MDKELRKEFRLYKTETDDRIKRLEDDVKALREQQTIPATIAPSAVKKVAGDAPTGETAT